MSPVRFVQQLVFRVALSLQPQQQLAAREIRAARREGGGGGGGDDAIAADGGSPLPSFLPSFRPLFASDESAKDQFGRRKSTASGNSDSKYTASLPMQVSSAWINKTTLPKVA